MNIIRRAMWSQTVNNSKDEIYDAHIRFDDILHKNSIKSLCVMKVEGKMTNMKIVLWKISSHKFPPSYPYDMMGFLLFSLPLCINKIISLIKHVLLHWNAKTNDRKILCWNLANIRKWIKRIRKELVIFTLSNALLRIKNTTPQPKLIQQIKSTVYIDDYYQQST